MYLKVNNEIWTSSKSEGVRYGWWKKFQENNITGIEIVPEEEYYDLAIDFEVKPNDIVYLVTVQYSSGDSFGNSRGNISYIGVWLTKEKAELAKTTILSHYEAYKDDRKQPELTLISETGIEWKDGFPSWLGYFEHIEQVEVHTLEVS